MLHVIALMRMIQLFRQGRDVLATAEGRTEKKVERSA